VSPFHQQRRSVRDQSRIGAHTAPQSRLWSRLTAGALFLAFVRVMSRSGTDLPYRPTPNLEGCQSANGWTRLSVASTTHLREQPKGDPAINTYTLGEERMKRGLLARLSPPRTDYSAPYRQWGRPFGHSKFFSRHPTAIARSHRRDGGGVLPDDARQTKDRTVGELVAVQGLVA